MPSTTTSPPPAPPVPAGASHVLTDDQRRECWARLEASDPQAAWAKKRPPRLAYERGGVVVRATHPGGGSTVGTVCTHDLSAAGTSFLHQGYLHVGTSVDLTLPRRLAGEEQAEGRVAWCRHVGGTWHAVGVRFGSPVSLKLFVSPAEFDRLPTGSPIRPETLAGQVLMVDDQEVDRMLFAHLLRATKLAVTGVTDVDQAVQSLRGLVFDVVCLDLNLGVDKPQGELAVKAIRKAGHKGPIVAVSGDTAARLESIRGVDVEHTLAKPYDAEQLMGVLAAALGIGTTDPADLLYSDLSDQDDAGPLLGQFCDRVQAAMREFRRHVDGGKFPEVRLTCQMLRGSAGGYGYPAVSAAATDAVKALDACGDVGEASPDLLKLIALCKRLTAAKRPRAEA